MAASISRPAPIWGTPRWWRQRWARWMDGRTPARDQIELHQRNVYILPSKGGWGYAMVTLVLLLAAINEQLNLAYALAFLLGGVGLSAMWSTHMNLRDLSMTLGPATPVHAGQDLLLDIRLASTRARPHLGLWLGPDDDWREATAVAAEAGPGCAGGAAVAIGTRRRGWMPLPRLRVQTLYPLGLFRAWGIWRPERRVMVWPQAEPSAPDFDLAGPSLQEEGADGEPNRSEVDLLRPWRPGDALKSVVWKKSAVRLMNDQPPISREPPPTHPRSLWIDWTHAHGLDDEARLSRLTAWLLRAEEGRLSSTADPQAPYGLRVPGIAIAPDRGPVHLARCLDVLALWGTAA